MYELFRGALPGRRLRQPNVIVRPGSCHSSSPLPVTEETKTLRPDRSHWNRPTGIDRGLNSGPAHIDSCMISILGIQEVAVGRAPNKSGRFSVESIKLVVLLRLTACDAPTPPFGYGWPGGLLSGFGGGRPQRLCRDQCARLSSEVKL